MAMQTPGTPIAGIALAILMVMADSYLHAEKKWRNKSLPIFFLKY
ncbi:hypothetical protein [Methanobacterium subterraneum]|nr:hypothetical protein [Methanobacterium subterraneum]